jgi:hypothetical protein
MEKAKEKRKSEGKRKMREGSVGCEFKDRCI